MIITYLQGSEMKFFMYLILIFLYILLIYQIYKLYKNYIKYKYDNDHLQSKNDLQIVEVEVIENCQDDEIQSKQEIEYNYEYDFDILVKKSLYNPIKDSLYYFSNLYDLVICEHELIDEPFHSKFYEILIFLSDNEFMIVDPSSKVINLNIRDENNQMKTSKSYNVFSLKDIYEFVIKSLFNKMLKLKKEDTQNIIIAIFVVLLEKSIHYNSNESTANMMMRILNSYKYKDEIMKIVQLIKSDSNEYSFIKESINTSLLNIETYPYNDFEIQKPLKIREELPQKYLKNF